MGAFVHALTGRIIQGIYQQHDWFCAWFYHVLKEDDQTGLRKQLRTTFKLMGPEIAPMWLMSSGRI